MKNKNSWHTTCLSACTGTNNPVVDVPLYFKINKKNNRTGLCIFVKRHIWCNCKPFHSSTNTIGYYLHGYQATRGIEATRKQTVRKRLLLSS